jgi:hypothetical protein
MSLGYASADIAHGVTSRLPGKALPSGLAASRNSRWKWGSFLTGLGSQLFVRLIGYLAFTEVFFLIALPLRIRDVVGAVTRTPCTAIFTVLWLLNILAALLANFLNGSPFDILARGVSRTVFIGLDVVCLLAFWLRRPNGIEYFMLGYPISLIASRFVFKSGAEEWLGSNTMDFTDWKSNTSYIVVGLLYPVVARYYRRSPLLIAAVTAGTSVLFLAMGSRAFSLTQFLAAVLMVVFSGKVNTATQGVRTIAKKRRTILFKVVVGCLIAAATAYGTGKAYKSMTRAGYLGDKELKKLEAQENTAGGLLVGGRFGFFVGLWAACHKPILGHGSWPIDRYGYTQQVVDYFQIDTQEAKWMTKNLYWIPSHSAIVGGWVEHGFLELLFWLFVLYLVLVNFPRAAIVLPAYAGLYSLFFSEMLWHLFFSPAGHRVILATKIVAFLVVDDAWRRQTRSIRESLLHAARSDASSGNTDL